eukprot:CAMPEP_0184645302 /NCGR_PEP_ID=MMETSP0308-20130426/1789_1 /TAXON_ID=38269 /ORGANISM="Gloeochaete witrockiana, Strain SAG 46.84" /LENGTH=89 /DNA_ID=CAMNT_0027074201 /DNA_START=225 /DNA_END=494 /DNA_ORIENTATION=+
MTEDGEAFEDERSNVSFVRMAAGGNAHTVSKMCLGGIKVIETALPLDALGRVLARVDLGDSLGLLSRSSFTFSDVTIGRDEPVEEKSFR